MLLVGKGIEEVGLRHSKLEGLMLEMNLGNAGLGVLSGGPPLELNTGNFLSHAINAALYVSENLLVFAFASVALDFCFKMRLLSPFPIRKSNSNSNKR